MKPDTLKNLIPLAILSAFGIGLFVWWRKFQADRTADEAQAYDNANTYGGGPAVSADANLALLEAMFSGGSNQAHPAFPQVTGGDGPPLAQPGALPVTLGGGPNTSQGM